MGEQQKQADVHLAFRTEGQCINAYLEWQGTAAAVQLVGSISLRICGEDPLVFATWQKLMAFAIGRFGERISGEPTVLIGHRRVPAGGNA